MKRFEKIVRAGMKPREGFTLGTAIATGILLAVIAVLLTGCAFMEDLFYEDDGFAEIAVPVDTAATIAGQIEDILLTADLNGDGVIQGDDEWLELLLGIYDAVRG